jgi:ankyrin repeat protein
MSIIPISHHLATPPFQHASDEKNEYLNHRPSTDVSMITTSSMTHTRATSTTHLKPFLLADRIESAFASRDLEQVLELIHSGGVSANYARDKCGNTPLILAVREGDEQAVQDLLGACRADPNLPNALGRTPLMCAAASGMEHIITLLLLQMSQGDSRMRMLTCLDDSGKNSLDWARIGRRNRCISTLELAIQRSIQYCRSERKEANRKEILRRLVEENRNRREMIEHAIQKHDTESMHDLASPLEHANLRWNQSNKVMTLETLRRGDFDPIEKNKEEFSASSNFQPDRPNLGSGTVVGIANRAALDHAVEEMMQDGGRIVNPAPLNADIQFAHPNHHRLFADHECMGGITPLMYAAGNDIPDLITLLVRRAGANVNLRSTRMGHTPLTWAACSGALSAVTSLLSEGAELDYPTSEGRTALMVACSNAHKHMVASLLEYTMQLAQRRASRDSDAQYNSLVRVLGHEIAAHARYSEAGKDSEGWQHYFDELVFGLKDQDGRNAVVHARTSAKYKQNHKNTITKMLEQAKGRIVDRQQKLAYQRWVVQPIKCELCGNWEKRNRMEKHTMYNCPMRLVRCRFCNESMPAKTMSQHVDETCERRLLKCEQKCGKEIEARHLQAHQNNFCTRRIVLCRLDCGARCHFNTRTQHEVDKCQNRQVDCVDCNAHMQAKEMSYHLYTTCPQRLVFCGRGCGHRGPFILNEPHEQEKCLLRPLPCRYEHLGCEAIIGPPDKREVHELYLCQKRPVSCKLGDCQHVCRAEEMPSHQANDCLYRLVECKNKCGAHVMAKDRELHERPGETGLCRNRPVRCVRRDITHATNFIILLQHTIDKV